MNFVSTTGQTPPIAWCVVYDSTTGEVVHFHGFTGFDIAADTDWARAMRAEAALAHVKMHVNKQAKGLEVAHGDPKKLPPPGSRLGFDLKKKKLVTSGKALSLRDALRVSSPPAAKTPAETKTRKKR